MALNKKKCFHLSMNSHPDIHFANGEKMNSADSVTYLGSAFNKKGNPNTEISARLGKAMDTLKKLSLFWKNIDCDKAWKLQVYNAVIVSQLTYALDSIHIPEKLNSRLDAFQMKGLRQILGIEHSYKSHITNNEVMRKANLVRNKTPEIEWGNILIQRELLTKKIKPISETLKERRAKLLGHLLRAPEDDLMKKITFDSQNFIYAHTHRRVGHPRGHWPEHAMAETLWEKYQTEFDKNDDLHLAHIVQMAEDREI